MTATAQRESNVDTAESQSRNMTPNMADRMWHAIITASGPSDDQACLEKAYLEKNSLKCDRTSNIKATSFVCSHFRHHCTAVENTHVGLLEDNHL